MTSEFIRIRNKGEIEHNALTLLGANSKDGDGPKIGYFGTGLKYSIAWLLREGVEFHIFSGLRRIHITTEDVWFRGKSFHRIVVDGHVTSLTTDMAKDWKPWYILREIYSNAKDEPGADMDTTEMLEPKEGETHIYVRNVQAFDSILQRWNYYFLPTEATPLATNQYGELYSVQEAPGRFYRQGINVLQDDRIDNQKSIYSYNVHECAISETRVAAWPNVRVKIWGTVQSMFNPDILRAVLRASGLSDHIENPQWMSVVTLATEEHREMWSKALEDLIVVPHNAPPGILCEDEIPHSIVVSESIFNDLKNDPRIEIRIPRRMSHSRPFKEIEATYEEKVVLERALDWCYKYWTPIPYPVQIVEFLIPGVVGAADIEGQRIYIGRAGLTRGMSDIVKTLVEETVHIKHQVKDESRSMQEALLSELITVLEHSHRRRDVS